MKCWWGSRGWSRGLRFSSGETYGGEEDGCEAAVGGGKALGGGELELDAPAGGGSGIGRRGDAELERAWGEGPACDGAAVQRDG